MASSEQLAKHDDICSICYNEMKSAYITPCGHIFHGMCLRKWLYVKETCPMCHRDITQREEDSSELSEESAQEETSTNIHHAAAMVDDDVSKSAGVEGGHGSRGEGDGDSGEKQEGSDCSCSGSCSTDSMDMVDQDEVETETVEADRL
jgi:hypothetical protein